MTDYEKDMWLQGATVTDMVQEFQLVFGQETDMDWDDWASNDLRMLRESLLQEEFEEVMSASTKAELLKELVDLVYVAVGYAVTFGWDFDEAFRRVHESNMSKLVDGEAIFREDGKVLKGPNYFKPDLGDLV